MNANIRRLLAALFIALLCVPQPLCAAAQSEVRVSLNGAQIALAGAPILQDGRVAVPVRPLFEALGFGVYWMQELRIVFLAKDDVKLFMRAGYDDFYTFWGDDIEAFKRQMVDEVREDMEAFSFCRPLEIRQNRAYAPIRDICEAIGVAVSWDAAEKTVRLAWDEQRIQSPCADTSFAPAAFAFFRELTGLAPADGGAQSTEAAPPEEVPKSPMPPEEV